MLAAVLFASLTLAFFWPALTGGAPFSVVRGDQNGDYPWAAYANGQPADEVQADQAQLSYPWDASLKAALQQGTVPFWSGGTFNGGYPLYANGSSAEFYPPRLLLASITSPEDAHAWFSALHLFLAGMFAYLFACTLGIGWFGALLTGISWMFASFNIAWLPLEVIAPVMALLPLDLLLVRRAWKRGSPSSAVLAGCAIGLTMMAGHVLYMGLTVLIALVYCGCLATTTAFKDWPRRRWRAFRTLYVPAGIAAVGAGIAAAGLLPTLDNLAQIDRASFSYATLYRGTAYVPTLAPPSALLHALLPFTGPLTIAGINLEMTFVGSITACLAVLGFVSRRPGSGLGRALVVIAGLGAIGGPLTWLLYHTNPLLQVESAYGRLFEWWAFGLALLGGLGLDRVLGWIGRAGSQPRHHRQQRLTVPRPQRVLVVGVVVITVSAVQLVSVASKLTQSFDTYGQSRAYPKTPLVSAIQDFQRNTPWPARIMFVEKGSLEPGSIFEPIMSGNIPQVFDIDQAGGYDSAIPQRTLNLLRVIGGESVDAVLRHPVTGAFVALFYPDSLRYDLLERTGIAALAEPPTIDYGNGPAGKGASNYELRSRYDGKDGKLIALSPDEAGPRIVDHVEVVDSARGSLATFTDPSFNYTEAVVLERSQIDRLPSSDRTVDGSPSGSEVRASQVGVNTLTVRGRTYGSGWLVIPENWAPGWTAQVNGRPMPVLRGNYTQQVLRVPNGPFVVQLRYEAPGFRTGVAVSLSTLLIVLLFALLAAFRRHGRRRYHHHMFRAK